MRTTGNFLVEIVNLFAGYVVDLFRPGGQKVPVLTWNAYNFSYIQPKPTKWLYPKFIW